MKARYTDRFERSFRAAPQRVRATFEKQLGHLLDDLRHPSLRAKKYDESQGVWQARVNRSWRFYFTIEEDMVASFSTCLRIRSRPRTSPPGTGRPRVGSPGGSSLSGSPQPRGDCVGASHDAVSATAPSVFSTFPRTS
ncbi:MAG: hypothetical protein ACREIU_05595 [Planctomycetota bacterium]